MAESCLPTIGKLPPIGNTPESPKAIREANIQTIDSTMKKLELNFVYEDAGSGRQYSNGKGFSLFVFWGMLGIPKTNLITQEDVISEILEDDSIRRMPQSVQFINEVFGTKIPENPIDSLSTNITSVQGLTPYVISYATLPSSDFKVLKNKIVYYVGKNTDVWLDSEFKISEGLTCTNSWPKLVIDGKWVDRNSPMSGKVKQVNIDFTSGKIDVIKN